MDKHWRRLITAEGGCPLNLNMWSDRGDPRDRCHAINNGYPRTYQDINGVRFTADDVHRALPHMARKDVVKRIPLHETWESLITMKEGARTAGRRRSWDKKPMKAAIRRWRNGETVTSAARSVGVPRTSLKRILETEGYV